MIPSRRRLGHRRRHFLYEDGAETVREQLDDLAEALAKRDRKIEKLVAQSRPLAAEVARMKLRMAEADVARDCERRSTDFMPPMRRELN